MAQYYHILDYKNVPPITLSKLVIGLPPESRINLKLSGQKVNNTELLLASIYDQLNLLLWSKTKDGSRGVNRPKSLVEYLTGEEETKEDANLSFASSEDYEATRERLLKEMQGGEIDG